MTTSSTAARGALVVGCCILLAAGVPGVAASVLGGDASAPAGDRTSATGSLGGTAWAQTDTPVNNSTVQHEHPDRSGERGDTGRLLGWLSGRLTGGLEGSLVELSQAEYEAAKGLIDEEWRKRLGQFVDVAGDTDEETDDRTGETLNDMGATKRDYISQVQDYRQTLERLEEARAAGNTTAVRRSARRLEEIFGTLRRTNRTLARDYRILANLTGEDVERELAMLANITGNISSQQAEIRSSILIETRLSVRANRTTISFLDPVRLEGRLVASNGSGVGNAQISLRIGEQRLPVETDANGDFATTYRPVGLSLDAETLQVRYRPRPTAVYLGSNASVSVSVRQVAASLSVAVQEQAVAYGEPVDVRVTASAGDRRIPSVPLGLSLAGNRLATGTTDADGTASLTGQVPVTVRPGNRTLRVAIPWADRAIGAARERLRIRVRSTETDLDFGASATPEGALTVNGTLRTADGVAVPEQAVAIRAGGTQLDTVQTGSEGGFGGTIPPSVLRSAGLNGSVTVVAAFDGRGTNLENASVRQEVTIEYPPDSPDGTPGSVDDPADSSANPVDTLTRLDRTLTVNVDSLEVPLLPGLLTFMAVLLVVFGRSLEIRRLPRVEQWPAASPEPDPEPAAAHSEEELLVSRARELLDEGDPAQSVADAYAAGRTRLTRTLDLPTQLTHREFLATVGDRLDGEHYRDVAALADAYERSVFGEGVSGQAADDALEAAERLIGGGRSGLSSSQD